MLLLYVDDMIITGDDSQYIAFVKERLSEQFLVSNLGPLRYFLRIEVTSTPKGYYLSSEKYIQGILAYTCLTDQRMVDTPMELSVHLRTFGPLMGSLLRIPLATAILLGSLSTLGSLDLTFLTQFTS